ncbi:MAG: response regulator transcription factor [Thermoleophilia bacterium]
MPPLVLVVDDEPPLVHLVRSYLEREGFRVTEAGDGHAAVQAVRELSPDLVVLDLMLPGIDGIEACRRIRAFSDCYVVMLTARAEEIDMLVGLAVGADDYMTKPFSPRELTARVRAMLRRPRAADTGPEPVRRVGSLEVDPAAHEVRLDGERLELTPLEFGLLETLAAQPRVAFTRRQLIDRVWGTGWVGDEHLVDAHIVRLRRKLGDNPADPRFVQTVRGVGYRMGPG